MTLFIQQWRKVLFVHVSSTLSCLLSSVKALRTLNPCSSSLHHILCGLFPGILGYPGISDSRVLGLQVCMAVIILIAYLFVNDVCMMYTYIFCIVLDYIQTTTTVHYFLYISVRKKCCIFQELILFLTPFCNLFICYVSHLENVLGLCDVFLLVINFCF